MSTHDVRQVQGPAMSAGAQAQFGVVLIGAGMTVAMVTVSALLTVSTSRNSGTVDVGVGVTAFLLFTAAAAVGSAFGFLFGLPRARLTDQLATTGSAHPDTRTPSSHYLANSNLIKVSDWLTTIVIGLGLVNVGNAVPALRSLAQSTAGAPGRRPLCRRHRRQHADRRLHRRIHPRLRVHEHPGPAAAGGFRSADRGRPAPCGSAALGGRASHERQRAAPRRRR